MWGPIEEIRKMHRDERLGYLAFTSDDMTEQIVTYLISQLDVRSEVMDEFEELNQQIEFFKTENGRLLEENKELNSQVEFLMEKLGDT